MATNVTSYSILFNGSPDGYADNRAQLSLYNGSTHIAVLRFKDDGMSFSEDSETSGIIYMNLPSARFANIIDMLRNEKPIRIYFASGHAFLGTTEKEPVGEGE